MPKPEERSPQSSTATPKDSASNLFDWVEQVKAESEQWTDEDFGEDGFEEDEFEEDEFADQGRPRGVFAKNDRPVTPAEQCSDAPDSERSRREVWDDWE